MAFRKIGSLSPFGAPVLRSEICSASITITEGDAVMFTSGFVALGTAGSLLLGNVTSIVTNYGVGLETTGVAGAETGSFVGTYLTSSTNTTVAKVRAVVDISKETLYSADPDATIGKSLPQLSYA